MAPEKENRQAEEAARAKDAAGQIVQKESGARSTPENFWQAITQIVWQWNPRLRNFFFICAGIIFLLYIAWNALPEKTKTDLINRLLNQPPAPTKADPNSSSTSTGDNIANSNTAHNGISTELLREKSAVELLKYIDSLPPLQRQPVIKNFYIGRRVSWEGKVENIYENEPGFSIIISNNEFISASISLPENGAL